MRTKGVVHLLGRCIYILDDTRYNYKERDLRDIFCYVSFYFVEVKLCLVLLFEVYF